MFSTLKHFFFGDEPKAKITPDNRLFSPDGEFIAQYTRRRDAIRGAERRGFTVA